MLRGVLLFLVVGLSGACKNHVPVKKLTLVKSYNLQTLNALEPSGLTLWNGDFFTVSDKHNKIYQLLFTQDTIVLEPIISIDVKPNINFDFEGITHDENFFYLISEKLFKILKVSKDGRYQMWLTIDNNLKKAGQSAGLFQTHNAFLEGICMLGKNRFLLAAERQPRGFVEYNANSHDINAYQKNQAVFPYKNNRSPDFTGLSCEDGIYVLDRNAYVVAELLNVNEEYQESAGYSYQHIIERPDLIYQDMQYGHAEGLVVDGDYIYVLLDNNRNWHVQYPKNNDSLFLKLKK